MFNMCLDELNNAPFGKKFIVKVHALGIPPEANNNNIV